MVRKPDGGKPSISRTRELLHRRLKQRCSGGGTPKQPTHHVPFCFGEYMCMYIIQGVRRAEAMGRSQMPPLSSLAEGFPKRNPTPSLYQHPLTAIHHSSLRSRSGEIMRGVKFPPLPPSTESTIVLFRAPRCRGRRCGFLGWALLEPVTATLAALSKLFLPNGSTSARPLAGLVAPYKQRTGATATQPPHRMA